MGSSQSTKTVQTIVYKQANPELIQELKKLQSKNEQIKSTLYSLRRQLRQVQEESIKLSDARYYEKYRQESFDKFVKSLGTMAFFKPIKKKSHWERHHIVIGNISSGKSSLLNSFFDLKQKVGLGQCTPAIKKVTQFNDIFIWDSPGVNEQFEIYNHNVLSFFHCADKIFILYPDSLKSCSQIVKVMAAIKPGCTYAIRTQCDNWNENMHKTIQEQIATDKQQLKKWNILNVPVYATSAKSNLKQFDNLKVKWLMSKRDYY